MTIDPDEERYLRKFRAFPGVATCIETIRRAKGAYLEMALADLAEHAEAHLTELLTACEREPDDRIGALLLSVIADVRHPDATPLLRHKLTAAEGQRYWAMRGLHNVATPEARQALYDARSIRLATSEETASFHSDLSRMMAQKPGSEPRWWRAGIRAGAKPR